MEEPLVAARLEVHTHAQALLILALLDSSAATELVERLSASRELVALLAETSYLSRRRQHHQATELSASVHAA